METNPSPGPAPSPGTVPTGAYDVEELLGAIRTPYLLPDLVLGLPGRLAASALVPKARSALLALLLVGTLLFGMPFGLVLEPSRAWRVVILLFGTFVICFPSLHVFGAYVGRRVTFGQNLTLGMVIPCVAAIFTFGFFPIVWFLKATMADASLVGSGDLSAALLVVSALAGAGQLWRCARAAEEFAPKGAALVVLGAWHLLFAFVGFRLGHVLGLL